MFRIVVMTLLGIGTLSLALWCLASFSTARAITILDAQGLEDVRGGRVCYRDMITYCNLSPSYTCAGPECQHRYIGDMWVWVCVDNGWTRHELDHYATSTTGYLVLEQQDLVPCGEYYECACEKDPENPNSPQLCTQEGSTWVKDSEEDFDQAVPVGVDYDCPASA